MTQEQAERLVAEYADMVTRIGYTWFRNIHDAQDVCQMVFLKLLTTQLPTTGTTEERAFIIRVALNVCKDMRRSAWFRCTVGLTEASALSVELPSEDDTVLQAVQALPLKYRQVVYLHYYEGYGVSEIADLIQIRPALVSTRLARAKGKLRILLGDDFYEESISHAAQSCETNGCG